MAKKYELLKDDTKEYFGRTLYRIKALISFGAVVAGELGGYIETEKNLDQSGDAWVSGDA
ncbi:polymer-forming cytoskeletal protein, partial [Rodentibacter pneumotropicus]